MDAELVALKQSQVDLALALSKALAADAALDRGEKPEYQRLNEQARADVKKILLRLGYSYARVEHLGE